MCALKVVVLLVCVYSGMYATMAVIHTMLRTWTAYKMHRSAIDEKGVYGLRIATRFCASFVLILIQSVASLIWDLYMESQFPLWVRTPLTLSALFLAVTSVVPINLITSGIIEAMLRVSDVKVKVTKGEHHEANQSVVKEDRKSA